MGCMEPPPSQATAQRTSLRTFPKRLPNSNGPIRSRCSQRNRNCHVSDTLQFLDDSHRRRDHGKIECPRFNDRQSEAFELTWTHQNIQCREPLMSFIRANGRDVPESFRDPIEFRQNVRSCRTHEYRTKTIWKFSNGSGDHDRVLFRGQPPQKSHGDLPRVDPKLLPRLLPHGDTHLARRRRLYSVVNDPHMPTVCGTVCHHR